MLPRNTKGALVIFGVGAFALAVFVIYLHQRPLDVQTTQTTPPLYQTGTAFEVPKPDVSKNSYSDKNAIELTTAADAIITRARAVVEKHQLDDLDMTPAQKQALAERLAGIEQKIEALETQLK